jgi:Asp-tRNA(Asn)/Glu-tRNA(Gln) amidotransferase A subunit family amidase
MLRELATAVADGQVSPKDLVEESLRRIEAANGELNAVVTLRADEALDEAATLSDERRRGPLAGIPLLVKDLTPVAGMRTTYGSTLYADAPPDERDATFIARLRAAGAIVVGKTNTPAFGHTAFTTNPVFGATVNPWNRDRSPGGSSGGSAAALAAGLAPIATTTDGGGSVRIPACMCGLVGYKPTLGVIGRDSAPRWMTFSTSGATQATVADVVHEATVMAGPTATDIHELPAGAIPLEPALPSRVIACRTWRSDVDPDVEAAFDRTLAALEVEGLPVERVDRVFVADDLAYTWFVVASAELAQSMHWCRDRWDELEQSLTDILRFGEAVSLTDYIAAQRRRFEAAAELELAVGTDGVVVVPTSNVTSWSPTGPLPSAAGAATNDPAIAVNTVELNLTGHPGVSVPMGIAPDGVPMGMQVVAPRFQDRLALGLAAAVERVQPWPLAAPGYEPFSLS